MDPYTDSFAGGYWSANPYVSTEPPRAVVSAAAWVVANVRRVGLLALTGDVGDASGCSTAQDGAGGTRLRHAVTSH